MACASTSVYRCYAAHDELLYVGCSGNVKTRLMQHRSTSHWAVRMMHYKVRVYPNRARALAVEDRAIRLLKPTCGKLTPSRQIGVDRRNREAWEKAAKGKGQLAELAQQALAMPNCPEV